MKVINRSNCNYYYGNVNTVFNRKCYICGKASHIAKFCWHNKERYQLLASEGAFNRQVERHDENKAKQRNFLTASLDIDTLNTGKQTKRNEILFYVDRGSTDHMVSSDMLNLITDIQKF